MKLASGAMWLGVCAVSSSNAFAEVGKPVTTPMPFEACLELVAQTAQTAGSQPKNLEETADLRIVHIETPNGSILVTCNRSQKTMTIVPSRNED